MGQATIIPAQPGYQVKYPDKADTWPVIAWGIKPHGDGSGIAHVTPITPNNNVNRPGFILLFEGARL